MLIQYLDQHILPVARYRSRVPMSRNEGHTRLSEVLASPALARLVLHFSIDHEEPQHVRGLQRRCGLSMSSLHRELRRLEALGLVERMGDGAKVRYRAVETHPGWAALRQLVRQFADPAEVVGAALAGVGGIEAAFVFGSFARGDFRDDSDVDVLVLGDAVDDAALGRRAAEASLLLGRPVEVRSYTHARLDRQLAAANAVLRRILAGPKRWLVGNESGLPAVAA